MNLILFFMSPDDTERLIQNIDDNEDGFVDFREFLCVYLSAASRGALSYSSPGFADMLARLERLARLAQLGLARWDGSAVLVWIRALRF